MGFLDMLRGKPDVKRLRERRNIEGLVKALSHKEWTVRSEAAEALGELGDQRAVPALIGALEDKYWGVCRNAIKALAMFKDPDSVTSLLRVLQDPSSGRGKRSNVAAVLEQTKDPRAVQPLSLVLETTPGAARALGAIGGPDSVRALKSGLEHKEWKMHREAAKALETIRETATDPSIRADISAALEEARKDRSEEYRKLDIFEALKSVESYRLNILDVSGIPVRWPNCCCLCLGPVEVRKAASYTDYITAGKGKYRVVSIDGVPYCKFCEQEATLGVDMEVMFSSVTLIFKNPEYGKMFAQANPGVAWPRTATFLPRRSQ